jgi:hypothetical protein
MKSEAQFRSIQSPLEPAVHVRRECGVDLKLKCSYYGSLLRLGVRAPSERKREEKRTRDGFINRGSQDYRIRE